MTKGSLTVTLTINYFQIPFMGLPGVLKEKNRTLIDSHSEERWQSRLFGGLECTGRCCFFLRSIGWDKDTESPQASR